jgi:hypothetical protein
MSLEARISVKVSPGAARNEVTGYSDGVLQVKVKAAPLKGKANRELVVFLSRRLDVSRDRIKIIMGNASRRKLLAIDGLSQQTAINRLLTGPGSWNVR